MASLHANMFRLSIVVALGVALMLVAPYLPKYRSQVTHASHLLSLAPLILLIPYAVKQLGRCK
jgi:hypothetical protein